MSPSTIMSFHAPFISRSVYLSVCHDASDNLYNTCFDLISQDAPKNLRNFVFPKQNFQTVGGYTKHFMPETLFLKFSCVSLTLSRTVKILQMSETINLFINTL